MSVFCDIQEHIIKDTAEHEVTFMHIKEHLIRLGTAMNVEQFLCELNHRS